MKHVLLNGNLIWEALQEESESDFDALWRVLQSSTVQGYITQDDLDTLYYRIATERGVELAFVVVSHVQQVLTVYSPELHHVVDVAIAPDRRAQGDPTHPFTDRPLSDVPLVSVPEFLERHTLNQIFERSAVKSYLTEWHRKGLQSDFDSLLLVPLALTLLLQNTPLGQTLITTLMSWISTPADDENDLNHGLEEAKRAHDISAHSQYLNNAPDISKAHLLSIDPETLPQPIEGLEAEVNETGDRPGTLPSVILLAALNSNLDWSSLRQMNHQMMNHSITEMAKIDPEQETNAFAETHHQEILPSTESSETPDAPHQVSVTVVIPNDQPTSDRLRLPPSTAVVVLRDQPTSDRSHPTPTTTEAATPTSIAEPNSIAGTNDLAMAENDLFLLQPEYQENIENHELEGTQGVEGDIAESDGTPPTHEVDSPATQESTANSSAAEIDIFIAIAFPYPAKVTPPDTDEADSNLFVLTQPEVIQSQKSDQNDALNPYPVLNGKGYGLMLDLFDENSLDTFDELLEGGYQQLQERLDDFAQMPIAQQISALEPILNPEQDYQVVRVTSSGIAYSDRIEIGLTLTVTDFHTNHVSRMNTPHLLDPMSLLN